MGRAPRIDVENGWYHVMNRGAGGQATFRCDEDRVDFGRLLGTGHDRFGVIVHAYCLMTNHFHLLVQCPHRGLVDFMHLVGSSFVRHANERSGRDGPLFRGRYHSVLVRDDTQLVTAVRYIHRNALDLPGVTAVDEYRWSSHRTYLGHRRTPSWMRTDAVLAHFGGDAAAFHRFVAADSDRRDRSTSRRRRDLPAVESIADLVLEEHGDRLGGARQGVYRTVLLLVADRLGETEPASQLVERLRFAGLEAQRAAQRRARRRAASDPVLVEIVDRVVTLLP